MTFCEAGGGLWATIQAYVSFLVTNIFAHAATIHLPYGLDGVSTILAIMSSIFLPVFAGDRAFHSIHRWFDRLTKGKMTISDVLGGSTMEDAATSGVLAICVPLRFAPIVFGRWDQATTHQNITMLDNEEFWPQSQTQPTNNPEPKLPFKISGKSQEYVPFILPPTTTFPGYQNYSISPSSGGLSQIIAIIQVFLSSRQLYLNYASSIVVDGLASPYLAVIPYTLMSIVNMLANALVGQYTQVTMMPMARDTLPPNNEVFIGGTPEEYALNVFAIRRKESQPRPSAPPPDTQKVPVGTSAQPPTQPPENLEIEGTNSFCIDWPELWIEFTGNKWVPLPSTQGSIEQGFQKLYVTNTHISNLGFFHIWRTESWTSVCYDVTWKFVFGKAKEPGLTEPVHEVTAAAEEEKKRAVFFRQKFLFQFGWKLMRRDLSGPPGQEDLNQLKIWLEANYPGIDIPLNDMNEWIVYWRLISGIVLQILVTVLLGGLTRFHVGNPNHAAWILVWMYCGASLRWVSLIIEALNKVPSLLRVTWFFFGLGIIYDGLVVIGICGGITVIVVELFQAMCGTPFSISPGVWILIGVVISVTFGLAFLVVFYSSRILGMTFCLSD
jgi:hypothetical protein